MSRRQRLALIGAFIVIDVLFTAAVLYGWSWVTRSALADLMIGGPGPGLPPADPLLPKPVMRILPLEAAALVEVALIGVLAFGRQWRTIIAILLSGPALVSLLYAGLMLGRAIPGILGHFAPLVFLSSEFDSVDGTWTAVIAYGPPVLAVAVVGGVALARSLGKRHLSNNGINSTPAS